MLKTILMVTMLSLNLQNTEDAYRQFLGYQVVERGTISQSLANSWGTKEMAGRNYLLMQPESKSEVFLRFIERRQIGNYQPMRQEGWNAIEMLVKDPDQLAERLQGSPFNVVGPPKFLTEKNNIRAMQAIGPNNELLYFTRIIDPAKSRLDLGQASSFVDRIFIMVLGGKDVTAIEHFYRENLKQSIAGPYPYRIEVLSKAYKLPAETLHPLSIMSLPNQFMVEIDQYPTTAKAITAPAGMLPPGIAMVTFRVDKLTDSTLPFFTGPATRTGKAYGGQRSATLQGAAGELIELVETPRPSIQRISQ